MCRNDLISVVIPIYNAERFLGECIESVLNQTYTRFELLLINDGSSDHSSNICDEYAKKDSRIRVFHNTNHGVSFSRNFGIDQSAGEMLCFVDADDILLPDYLQRLYSSLVQDEEATVAYCGYRLLYDGKTVQRSARIAPGKYTFDDLSGGVIDDGTLSGILFGSVWCAMYRTKVIREHRIRFDASIKKNEDGLFNLHLLPLTKTILVLDYNGYMYRQWKTGAGKKVPFRVSNELDKATAAIAASCSRFENLDVQLRCRNVSVAFWNLLSLPDFSENPFELSREVKRYILQTSLFEDYSQLDFSAISKYKRILINLLYRKHYFMFVILVKYLKPVLEKIMNH